MKKLAEDAFERARDFLKFQARPLEGALFDYYFEGGQAERVLVELGGYQNADGGFGNALEPDLRTPTSSALATSIALSILKELDVPAGLPLAQKAVAYLLSTFDAQTLTWRVVPPDTNDFPHAPWWHEENGSLARTFGDFRIIPRARLLSLLPHFAQELPVGWLATVREDTVSAIETDPDLGSGGGDDLVQALTLAEADRLPEALRLRLIQRLATVVPGAVSRTPEEWATYSREPLKLAPSPVSLAAPWLADILPAHLDYRIGAQAADGAWNPTWSWFGAYPQVWEQAREEWRGELTLRMLLSLRAYGRLER